MLGLYEGGYTYIDWERRKALKGNNLAKWLAGFYSSHANPYAYKVETIKNLCGSTVGRPPDFRRMLKAAVKELVQVGAIKSWEIEDDLVRRRCRRLATSEAPGKSLADPVPECSPEAAAAGVPLPRPGTAPTPTAADGTRKGCSK